MSKTKSLAHTLVTFNFYLQDPTHSWSGGLDAQLKTHDLNTDQGMSQTCQVQVKVLRHYRLNQWQMFITVQLSY